MKSAQTWFSSLLNRASENFAQPKRQLPLLGVLLVFLNPALAIFPPGLWLV